MAITEDCSLITLSGESFGDISWKLPRHLQNAVVALPEEMRSLVSEEIVHTLKGFFLLYPIILSSADTQKRIVFLNLLNGTIATIVELFLTPAEDKKEDIFGEYLKNMPLPVKSS